MPKKDVEFLSALASPIRLEIVKILADEFEVQGGVLQYELEISVSHFLYHANKLRRAGIISARHTEYCSYYTLADKHAERLVELLAARANF